MPDEFPVSDILNIYYDTPDNRVIRESIEKPAYKEKLRMRSYGVPDAESKVFVEIKKKCRGIVYKRRVKMKYADAVRFLGGGEPPKDTQITREIAYFLKFYSGIRPAMFIYYHRLSYLAADDPLLRITFDSEVTARSTDLELEKGIYGKRLLPDGVRLMEVKTADAMPLWLADALDRYSIYPGTFSKYGTAYTENLKGLLDTSDVSADNITDTDKGDSDCA